MAATDTQESEVSTVKQGVVFRLGESAYCLDITAVDEIVERGTLTPLPNTAEHFEGVMDLRGETTTIFNPRSYFDIDAEEAGGDRILILDREDGNVGWIVDSVERVIEYTDDAIESEMSDGAVEGVLRRDDGFIIVVDPSVVDDTT
ncbi:chemotaxis protein CheW [Halanaeroarchaeum sp. HSR-CO]|uniref:chemotaxis protein CheW n=1 Tax=Halanaeroarchaeum sp. HSR-CO TaxID=2866382 RepID=UPI00217EF8CA|nr:chemotaxis protein CheW [Halanaeroarchaeum sp. HSR-CO]